MKNSRVGRPRGQNVENTNRRRKQLIDAAVESIVEHGLSTTTFDTVAKASGLSKGTAVFYFKSKDALLYETFRYRLEEYRTTWMEALPDSGSDPVDRVAAMVFASLDPRVMTPQNLAFWNSFWPEASRNESLNQMSDQYDTEWYEVLLSLCEDAKEFLGDSNWTPESATKALEFMCEGAWTRLHYSPKLVSPTDAREASARLLSAIFPSRADEIMKRARET